MADFEQRGELCMLRYRNRRRAIEQRYVERERFIIFGRRDRTRLCAGNLVGDAFRKLVKCGCDVAQARLRSVLKKGE
ncbi:hypothetical protein NE850_18020 [Paraburkholderia sp. USG1]|uniref:hypothetical protein n=1 Tax=Paraburkholderia sp. USG1 TaxID=2952268 RepID=UPI00286575B0|nr:hypothetical protein [Paraburkholderia sp. USG1]MDR8398241.1 hypothetical protein [Paraburkholderia sp. USG1]